MRETTEDLFRRALERIAAYDSPAFLRRQSERSYGLDFTEALEMAYDNMRDEARTVLRKRPSRKPKSGVDGGTSNGRNS
jgi:hypothetical protein